MVKLFVSFLLSVVVLSALENQFTLDGVESYDDPVIAKIKTFIDEKTYTNNEDFIRVIFDPKSAYYIKDRVDAVKIIQTLKDNGLLKLFFKSPQEFTLNFKTNGYPIFFVRIMDDTLRSIGYFRYVTSASHLDASEFSWSIKLVSEYLTDPLILQNELNKSGCEIVDVTRNNAKEWTFTIDMDEGHLNLPKLENAKKVELRRSLYAHWFNVSEIRGLNINSSRRNHWYPYIAYYDASLHLVKLLKRDRVYKKISLVIPKNAKYMKISDLYTLKNVRDGLILHPLGSR
ncbi:hypothetical protein [Sulfurimonas sp.]|uniref:hypothetical protein n=1 Tax=Sulfurimonas sp. TaxID=2022749 RepID=UPI002625E400|nr:hypothetical protein [Sulfurimonas sp.]